MNRIRFYSLLLLLITAICAKGQSRDAKLGCSGLVDFSPVPYGGLSLTVVEGYLSERYAVVYSYKDQHRILLDYELGMFLVAGFYAGTDFYSGGSRFVAGPKIGIGFPMYGSLTYGYLLGNDRNPAFNNNMSLFSLNFNVPLVVLSSRSPGNSRWFFGLLK